MNENRTTSPQQRIDLWDLHEPESCDPRPQPEDARRDDHANERR